MIDTLIRVTWHIKWKGYDFVF